MNDAEKSEAHKHQAKGMRPEWRGKSRENKNPDAPFARFAVECHPATHQSEGVTISWARSVISPSAGSAWEEIYKFDRDPVWSGISQDLQSCKLMIDLKGFSHPRTLEWKFKIGFHLLVRHETVSDILSPRTSTVDVRPNGNYKVSW